VVVPGRRIAATLSRRGPFDRAYHAPNTSWISYRCHRDKDRFVPAWALAIAPFLGTFKRLIGCLRCGHTRRQTFSTVKGKTMRSSLPSSAQRS